MPVGPPSKSSIWRTTRSDKRSAAASNIVEGCPRARPSITHSRSDRCMLGGGSCPNGTDPRGVAGHAGWLSLAPALMLVLGGQLMSRIPSSHTFGWRAARVGERRRSVRTPSVRAHVSIPEVDLVLAVAEDGVHIIGEDPNTRTPPTVSTSRTLRSHRVQSDNRCGRIHGGQQVPAGLIARANDHCGR